MQEPTALRREGRNPRGIADCRLWIADCRLQFEIRNPISEIRNPMIRSTLQIALVVWMVILVAISGRLLLAKRSNSVYPIFSAAGAAWLAGETVYRDPTPELDQFRYSPSVAAVFAAWSLLPAPVGEILWRLLNAAVLLGGLAYWIRWWRPEWD